MGLWGCIKRNRLGKTARICIMSVKIHEKNGHLIMLNRNHYIQWKTCSLQH